MIKAVFLGLDNVLLLNPDKMLACMFLKSISEYLKGCPSIDLPVLIQNTITHLREPIFPEYTNTQRATHYIAACLNYDERLIHNQIHDFFVSQYIELATYIKPIPTVRKLIQYLLDNDFLVVLSINPIYPKNIVHQMLVWAGLSDFIQSLALIPHAGNMHFTKPVPAYYAELAAYIGVEPDEIMVVGDHFDNDIVPAQTVGMHTLHIDPHSIDAGSGVLEDFLQLIQLREEDIPSPSHTIEMIEPQLMGNIAALLHATSDVPEKCWTQHPESDEWSMAQIVCHLAESEVQVQRPRLQWIVNEDNPFLIAPKIPPRSQDVACKLSPQDCIEAFLDARRDTLAFLRLLQVEDWSRPAHHSIFGPTTLLEMAYFTAQHDRLHINQLCGTKKLCL